MFKSHVFSSDTQSNPSQVTIQLLEILKVPVTRSTIIDTVEAHPDHPSLVSISDSLKKWKVNNVALKVDKERLDQLPLPFIVFMEDGRGSFEVVTEVNSREVHFHLPNGKSKAIEKSHFLQKWSEVVLLAERENNSGEKNYKQKNRAELFQQLRIPFIVATGLLLASLFFVTGFLSKENLFVTSFFLLLTKLAGMVISSLLLWYEIDRSNTALAKICKGRKTSCEAVLNSKHAKLFNWIGWSEIGFFYFAGGFIFLYFEQRDLSNGMAILSLLNLLVLPYTLFSVFYQWLVVKKWCRLCLVVQGLLMTEFLVSIIGAGTYTFSSFTLAHTPALALSFAIPVLFWAFIKMHLQNSHQYNNYKKALSRIKQNTEVFNTLLAKQKHVDNPGSHRGITLGKRNAAITLLNISNPHCPACTQAHFRVKELLEEHPDIKVQIIFTTKDDDNAKAALVKHFMAVYATGTYKIEEVLDFWYSLERKMYKTLADRFPLDESLLNNGEELVAMNTWCELNLITATPTYFLNGYQLPEIYTADDIGHFASQEFLKAERFERPVPAM